MRSEKQRVFDWLYRATFPAGVLVFDNLLVTAAETALGKSRVEAEDFGSQRSVLSRYWNWLLQEMDEDKRRGRKPLFVVKDPHSHQVSWFPLDVGQQLSSKDRLKQMLLKDRPAILNGIDAFSDREYEALGCVVSNVFGADRIHLTPRGNEGGIDFFASFSLRKTTHLFYSKSGPIRVVGQCKKYNDCVSVDRVKEFVTTLVEIKDQQPTVERVVPTWFRTSKGPIVGWLIAHKGFQSGAESKARNQGIVLSDSLDLAEMIAMSRHFAQPQIGSPRVAQLCAAVQLILSTFSTVNPA